MSTEGELPSASHIQAAQTLEMVSQQAIVHHDGQVLIESAVSENPDVSAMVSQPQHVVDMHNYVSTASDTVIHMSGGAILTQQGHSLVSHANVQIPSVPLPNNVAQVALPLMQPMQIGNPQSTENVVIKMLQQQQQLKLLEKSRAKQQQQLKQQGLQQVSSNLLQSIHVQSKLQANSAEVEAAEQLQRVQMQNASLGQQFTQTQLEMQPNTIENISHHQLHQDAVQDHQNALQVHSVVSLKDNIISSSPFLQIQDPKTLQQVVIETSGSDHHETSIQLQFIPDSEPASKNKQVVLPADAPPPPVMEDEDMEHGEPLFQEPVNMAYNDRLLWCNDCGDGVKMVCRQHGELIKVKDRLIPSRAKLTAPHHVAIKVIELRAGGKNVYGVFAKKVIQKRTVFGPYEGLFKDTWDYKGSSRLMLKLLNPCGPSQYLDCVDQEHCNWMIFVRPARSTKEQNLVAYQYKGSIYFASIKVIAPSSELRVWYAHSYGAAIGAHSLPMSVPDDNSDFAAVHLNEADFEGLELPMECENDEVDYQSTPSLAKEIQEQVQMGQSQTTENEAQPEDPKYTMTLEDYNKNESNEQRSTKRKGQPVKPKRRMITVEAPNKDSKQTKASTGKAMGVSTRSSRRGTRNVIPTDQEAAGMDDEIQDGDNDHDDQVIDLDDNDNDQDEYTDSYRSINVHAITHSHKKGPGRPKGSKTKAGSFKASRGSRKKIMKPKALFSCDECDKAFTSLTKLKSHSFHHTGERPFVCKFDCGKAFSSKFKQIRHELIHAGEKRHACPYCQKNFSRKDHLKNHLRIHDPNKELFKCSKCEKEYASPFAYKTHLAIHAAEEGDLSCGVCKEEFKEKEKLIAHLKVHAGARSLKDSGEKTQKCQYCDKLFFTKKDVKRHLVVHTKDRDFLCQFCPQRFGRRDHLIRHLTKAHPGEGGIPPASPTAIAQQENPTPKKSRSRSAAQRNQQGPMLSASTMSELLQSVTRNAILDTNLQPSQEVREIEVQLIRAKDSTGQEVVIPVSQTGIMTNMVGINYGGNMQGVYQGGSREVTAVLSQPISEPIMSGHFVPPTYVPQQGEEEDNANRQQQQTQSTLSSILSSDPRFAVTSLPQTQPQQVQHPIFTYGTFPGVGFSNDPNQPQKIMLTSVPNAADLGDQQIQIQQGNMVFTMKASALLDQYAQQAQAAAVDQIQQSQ